VKKSTVTVTYDQERMNALQLFLARKNREARLPNPIWALRRACPARLKHKMN